jgi:hypothetical protein
MGMHDKAGESGDPRGICRNAMSLLKQDMELPPGELENTLGDAERVLVRLRDELIGRMRREGSTSVWRSALEHVNTAISLVVAVEFPAAGVHAEYLKGARDVLQRAEEALPP